MQRSSLLFILAFAMLVAHLGGCGGSSSAPATPVPPPSIVDAKVSDVASKTTLSMSYGAKGVTVQVQIPGQLDEQWHLLSCPNLHATATLNGHAMNLEAGSFSTTTAAPPPDPAADDYDPNTGDGALSCGGSPTPLPSTAPVTSYECDPPSYTFEGAFTSPVEIQIADESGSMTLVASDLAINPTVTLDRAIFTTNDVVNATVNPPPAANASITISAFAWDSNPAKAIITPQGFSFDVPIPANDSPPSAPPKVDDAGMADAGDDDASDLDAGATSLPDCIDSRPGTCAGFMTIGIDGSAWPATVTQCNGATLCNVTRQATTFNFVGTFVTLQL